MQSILILFKIACLNPPNWSTIGNNDEIKLNEVEHKEIQAFYAADRCLQGVAPITGTTLNRFPDHIL